MTTTVKSSTIENNSITPAKIATTGTFAFESVSANTLSANTTTIVGGTISGATSVSDTIGNLRNLPIKSRSSTYTLVAADNGQVISITTGGVTVPSSIFSSGQSVSIYNNSANSQTITQGSNVTMVLASSGLTGNRTLGGYGLCTTLCISSNNFVIIGAGIS